MVGLGELLGSQAGSFIPSVHGFRLCRSPAPCPQLRQLASHHSRRGLRVQNMATISRPATLDKVSFAGDPQGTVELALKVTESAKATGLVHRYVTLTRQNARAVSSPLQPEAMQQQAQQIHMLETFMRCRGCLRRLCSCALVVACGKICRQYLAVS